MLQTMVSHYYKIKLNLNLENEKGSSTAEKMKFTIKDFFSKCDRICSFLRTWSNLLKKSLMENFIF